MHVDNYAWNGTCEYCVVREENGEINKISDPFKLFYVVEDDN